MDAVHVFGAIAIGVGATLMMDLWNLFLRRTFGIPSLDYCLLGRWLRHMPAGTIRHASIAAAQRKSFECPLGWIAHYTIGVAFALAFVALAPADWLVRPTLLPALLYGIGTVVFPFFIMQPSLGLGVAASRTAKPAQARLKSLATHAVFGVGLFACALGVGYVMRGHAARSRTALLVGTWRVVRFCDRDSTGAMVEPLGPSPAGYFVYTPTGQLSIQMMRTPPVGPLAGAPVHLSSLEELRSDYLGYFGTYTILSDTTVMHHVEGGTLPKYIGTDQPRDYRIQGDTLSIGAPRHACRVLIRIR